MSYATPADLIARKSPSTIAALVSDTDEESSEAELATDAKVLAALASASGAVEAALLQGGRYSVVDLTALSANASAYLKQMVCDIAMAYLFARKPLHRQEDYKAALELQDTYLERLRIGKNVFNIDANIDAGTPSYSAPTVAGIENLNLIVDAARSHYYPARRSNN